MYELWRRSWTDRLWLLNLLFLLASYGEAEPEFLSRLAERCPVSAIENIKERLRKYPDLEYEFTDTTITINAPSHDGFSLGLIKDGAEWTVLMDSWHGHFDTEDESLKYFAFGLSNECRLKITMRGNFAYRWTIQRKTADRWEDDYITGLLFFPFWKPKRVEYKQNDVL